MKKVNMFKITLKHMGTYLLSPALLWSAGYNIAFAENASSYVSVPPLINTSTSGDKPNVLFILDNSNSMDEAPSGQAVGSANPGSKSEIARNAIKEIIDNFGGTSRMGLMAYKQHNVVKQRLHDSQYDASFNPADYDASFNGDRASQTKRFRVPNPTSSGNYIHYNVALPFYAGSNYGTKFCYSSSADFDNGSEDADTGPWDSYACYSKKTGTSNANSGFSNHWTNTRFSPTDSDYAQNILDFGTHLTWQYVSETWFSKTSPGRGFLHVPIADVTSAQRTQLNNKLATSQFSSTTDTPLRNAGLTPVEGALQSARSYFSGTLPGDEYAGASTPSAPPANTCAQQDYVILVTDGLPSVDASGNLLTDTSAAIAQSAAEAAQLLNQGVKTYVIGFALPTGVDSSLLDTIAQSGGTGATYLANDSATLINAMQSIFLSFANRDASSSSSAVLANNSRGEGAVFQAVYSPKKEDSLGNEVNWVGSLFGLFVDENGLVREDTNQNGRLDGYDIDRVVEYFFDTNVGKARANLFYGPGNGTAPDVEIDAASATVDVEDLATLWEARDQLAELTDVLTQRPYNDNAATGRYIISSVDGTTALDFVQVSDEQIAALVAAQSSAQEALTNAQATLYVAQAQYDGAQNSVGAMEAQYAAAEAARDLAQAAVTTEQASVATAASALAAAQTNLATAQTTFAQLADTYTDNYTTRYDAAVDSTTELRNNVDNLQNLSAQDEFDALVNYLVATEGADASDPTVVNAASTLAAGQAASSNALAALNTETTDLETARQQAEQNQREPLNNLASSGTISDAERGAAMNTLATLFSETMVAFTQAASAYSLSEVATQRDAYVTALMNTGVNPNKGPVKAALDTYNAARAAEMAAEASMQSSANSTIPSAYDTFFSAQYGLINQHDNVADAQQAQESAQANVEAAAENLANAQELLATAQQELVEAGANLDGGQQLLAEIDEPYQEILSAYNSALAAYNQATATVNNSDTLINYLDVSSVEAAYNTVKFVRGFDGISGLRSRAIDYDDDGDLEVWRLGDIVHSSPALVGAPDEGYDVLHRDSTYAAFREQYKHRRNVVYVGANDGMLHAFNAGFWNVQDTSFHTTNTFADGGTSLTAHPLGAELWSYVPRAALPHLQWLTDPNYAHSYYVDGNPITFDANIFPADATHPYGWGTVLVVGMRFGGGPIQVDADADGTDDTTLRSSYALFDVTDPEQAPRLMAELSHPNLGFTTSVPTVIKKRSSATSFQSTSQNEWYLAFGSGPTSLADGSSTQPAGLFIYDLTTRDFVAGMGPLSLEGNSFVGDITSFDDGRNYIDDTLYFGVIGGSPAAGSHGVLKRTRLDTTGFPTSTVIDTGKPMIAAPTVINDRFGRRWIALGSGRLFMAPDNITTQAQKFFAVMEPVTSEGAFSWSTVALGELENVTDIEVRDTGLISRNGATVEIPSGSEINTFDNLVNAIREHRAGWVRDLQSSAGDPAARNISKSALGGNVLFFTSYLPSTNTCQPEGSSRLYGIDYRTGTALAFEVFAVDDDPSTSENDVAEAFKYLGQGLAAAPIVLNNSGGSTVFTSKSTTEQLNTSVRTGVYQTGRQSWKQIILD